MNARANDLRLPRFMKIFTSGLWAMLSLLFLLSGSASAQAKGDEAALWRSLASGNHFALLRHAIAPGTGDPENFTITDCTTQRNLSDRGRRQAVEIGNRFRTAGITAARVYSSQWCRCLETAELLALGEVHELPVLNSFFQRYADQEEQTNGLRQWLLEQDMTSPLVLVTHQVNITALTGIYPRSGELVLVTREQNGDFSVAGTIATD